MERSEQRIRAFEALLTAHGYDPKPDTRLPEHPGCSVLIPLQEDGSELIFFETHFYSQTDRFDIIQMYTTLAGRLSAVAAHEMALAINLWNRDFVFGSLAINETGDLYHRYCLAVPNEYTAEQAAGYLWEVFSIILSQIAEYHEDALSLASGVSFEALCTRD